MDKTNDTAKTEVVKEKAYTVPASFLLDPITKSQRISGSRAISFDNDKQRNAQNINKGLAKPGYISYDTLRRASRSVHVVRICITVLKEKVAKTKWIVRPKDPMADKKTLARKIDKISKLLKKPNRNGDTWRSFLDKSLEDLYVCDAITWEKTRYPNGELAELYQVDSTTIHPVFNEYGQQDVDIPLNTAKGPEVLPVSYLQVLNYSQYGGPQSGDIIAAWPKRDMAYFHMHPQGSLEGFGFGLSPIESVLSVVANILNADNFNGTYFEEGAFPPIILQLIGQMNERDLDATREYLMAELMGNFHRPAVMAGANKAEVLNLKDVTQRDMQFMEYTIFMAKLMTAAYGLSAQDINITDDVGSKNVAENQTELSEGKGYTSTLELIKEQINLIIEEDFGFDDIEFAWVADDTMSESEISDVVDKRLKNGTMTLNEARNKFGDKPFGTWADEPVILTSEGSFNIVGPQTFLDPTEVEEDGAAEEDDSENSNEESTISKSRKTKTLYISRPIVNADEIIKWAKAQGFAKTVQKGDMHVTVAFSRKKVDWDAISSLEGQISSTVGGRRVAPLGKEGAIVLFFDEPALKGRWNELIKAGASWDYDEYRPHVTLTYDGADVDISKIQSYYGPIVLGPEVMSEVDDSWVDNVKEKVRKAVYTQNFKTWMDDTGYGQPFIYSDILTGQGFVIKPPVAVNLMSQELEVELSQRISAKGVNVPAVRKATYQEVIGMLPPEVLVQFEQYVNLAPAYDSEKWKSKIGATRKFPYYLVQPFIEGYKLTDPLLVKDMKRDPESYVQAVRDLAALWRVERSMVLGDRRIDQYVISKEKRAWGFDYQFEGDAERYEVGSDALVKFLKDIPFLYDEFKKEVGIVKSIKRFFGRIAKIKK